MPLTLITGRANSGKTGELHAALREALRLGQRAALVLPSAPDVERAAEEFHSEQLESLSIVTLDSWIMEVWSLFGDGRRFVGDVTRKALLTQALDVPQDLHLAAAVRTPGFLQLLGQFAREASPSRRAEQADEVTVVIRRTLETYWQLLSDSGLIEPLEAVEVLIAQPPRIVDLVVANRFTDLSALQEEFLVGMSREIDVRLALPWEKAFPATEALDSLVGRISALGCTRHIPTPPARTELERLESFLYTSVSQPLTSEGQVLLAEAAGEEAEIALATEIVADEIEAGRSPDRIAVVFRDASSRRNSLLSAFAHSGIPVSLDISRSFREGEYGRAALALLSQCGAGHPERISLLGFLLSPYSFAASEDVQVLDAHWRRNRTQGGALIAQAKQALGRRTAALLELAHNVMNSADVHGHDSEWKDVAGLMFASAEERFRTDESRLRRDAAAHRTFCRVVSEACDARRLSIGPADIVAALQSVSVHEPVEEVGSAVLVTEAHRLRALRFDVVIIGGLTASEFSSDKPPSLKNELAEGVGAKHMGEDRLRERLLFYSLASRAKEKLILLRQVVDSEGQDRRPSVFWDEVVDLYSRPDGDEAGPPVRRLTMMDVGSAAPAYARGRRSERNRVVPHSLPNKGLMDDEVLASLASLEEFSITELETYLACPRRWFHERMIRPRDLDREFDAREAGSLVHRAMARFYELLPGETGAARVTAENIEPALSLADTVLSEVSQRSVTVQTLTEELALARAHKRVRAAIRQDAALLASMVPVCHELAFGDAVGTPVDIGGARLRGRIDRVDQSSAGVLVTDYKTGSVRGWKTFAQKQLIQVPLYAWVAGQIYETEILGGVYRSFSSGSLRGFWRSDVLDLCAEGSAVDGVGREEMAAVIADALELAKCAVAGIRAGEIQACPGSNMACSFCELATVCEVTCQ